MKYVIAFAQNTAPKNVRYAHAAAYVTMENLATANAIAKYLMCATTDLATTPVVARLDASSPPEAMAV